MSAVVIVGAQWGDEGKGKIVDIFTEHAQVVVRYAGGPNAGHTLVVGNDKVVVRLIPSGILRADTRCVLAQGMAIDPHALFVEMDELERLGHLREGKLAISDRAHAILPYHILIDTLREAGTGAIGTTKRGVGPCYEDKAARRGLRLGTLRDLAETERQVQRALDGWAPTARALGGELPSLESVMDRVAAVRSRLVPLLVDTSRLVDEAIKRNDRVLFEGAQGTLLDLDHGTYPFVTSSSAVAGGACTGVGVGPTRIDRVVGLVKAYTTRVGGGPFPTELDDAVGDHLRKAGAEFGSVTGRSRRCGWLDLPALRYAVRVNGLDALALTKLDVLTGLETIQVCVRYETPRGTTDDFPLDDLASAKPVYETFPGWSAPLGAARSLADLPKEAQRYLDFVAKEAATPLILVSVGSRRDETILLADPFSKR